MSTQTLETPHYFLEAPSFIAGLLIKRGAKIKTWALPSVNWRPLNEAAHKQTQAVLNEEYTYTLHKEDGSSQDVKHKPRLFIRTLGKGRGSLTSSDSALEEVTDPVEGNKEGMSYAEALAKTRPVSSMRPGPAVQEGPDRFEPTPASGVPLVDELSGEVVAEITQPGEIGNGKKDSKGMPVQPTKNGVAQ